MPIGTNTVDYAVTPGRKHHVYIDTPYSALLEDAFAITKTGKEIASRGLTNENSANVIYSPAGFYRLYMFQELPAYLSMFPSTAAILAASALQTLADYKEVKTYRPSTELSGVGYPGTIGAGDSYLQRSPTASQSWTGTQFDADMAAYGAPTLLPAATPLDRHIVGNDTYPNDTTIAFKFTFSGVESLNGGALFTYYFGGPSNRNGSGAYALVFDGSGRVNLLEKVVRDAVLPDVIGWNSRGEPWRYAQRTAVSGRIHEMLIQGGKTPNGRFYITFKSSTLETQPPLIARAWRGLYHNSTEANTYTYWIKPSISGYRSASIGAGNIRMDAARDLRGRVQFSKILYISPGHLFGDTFAIPQQGSRTTNLVLSWSAVTPMDSALTGQLFDAQTGVELTLVSSGISSKTYQANHNQSVYYPKFTFICSTDQTQSPHLYSYQVTKDGTLATTSTTEVELSDRTITPPQMRLGYCTDFSISGAESDPSHETARFTLHDVTDTYTALSTRAGMPVRIETEYDTADPSKRCVLHRGYVARANSHRMGYNNGQDYPSKFWRQYEVLTAGEWARLHESIGQVLFNWGIDPNASLPDGTPVPYKVTDIIRYLLSYAGYPTSMIDVPDKSIRLMGTVDGNLSEYVMEPGVNLAEHILDLAKKYLGMYLTFDANAGTNGKWKLLDPPSSPYTNKATFTTIPPSGKLSYLLGSYAASTAPIRKGTLNTFVKAPEANHVTVYGCSDPQQDGQHLRLFQFAANPLSYDCFTDSSGAVINTADTSSPDYMGRKIPLVIVDMSLRDQASVDWVCRRYYDFTCHAIKMAAFDAPLLLIDHEEGGGKKRPLRYYDPVLVTTAAGTGQWLVRNVNPTWHKDHVQMAHYELEAPRL